MRHFLSLVLIVGSLVISLLFSEFVSRFFLQPIDFLQPTLVSDQFLNHRIEPRSGGHDEWGFRNYAVPETARIVAVGDSQTYGVSATFPDSWPNQLSQMIGLPVYNVSLSGYGPLHYLHLLNTKVLSLQPEVVVVGLYFGNDFLDAYNLAHSNRHWMQYRLSDAVQPAGGPLSKKSENRKLLGGLRNWLLRKSVLYNAITRSAFHEFVRRREIEAGEQDLTELETPSGTTYLRPKRRFEKLDLTSEKISEGFLISLLALEQIISTLKSHDISLLVALIPTKEKVFARHLAEGATTNGSVLSALYEDEDGLRDRLKEFFEMRDIAYVDLVAALQAGTQHEMIYPIVDDHPNGAGYKIVAREVRRRLSGGSTAQFSINNEEMTEDRNF